MSASREMGESQSSLAARERAGAPSTEAGPPRSGTAVPGRSATVPLWLMGLLPLVLLGILVAVFLRFGPIGVFRAAFPPVEQLTIERVTFPTESSLRMHLVNGGPEPVTVAQVLIDEAYWDYTMDSDKVVPRLGSA